MNKHTMTAEEATSFEHGISTAHVMLLAMAAEERGCECTPYADWFTYNRWQAQGFQVQRATEVGHGVKLSTFRTVEDKDGKTHSVPWNTTVFCRCQVKPKENGNGK